jgi:hypothetical protein
MLLVELVQAQVRKNVLTTFSKFNDFCRPGTGSSNIQRNQSLTPALLSRTKKYKTLSFKKNDNTSKFQFAQNNLILLSSKLDPTP